MEAISFNSFSEALSSYFRLPPGSFVSFYIVSLQSGKFGFLVSDLIGMEDAISKLTLISLP